MENPTAATTEEVAIQKIRLLCSDFDKNKNVLKTLNAGVLKILIRECYKSLWQKYGNQKLAYKILEFLGEVKTHRKAEYSLEIIYCPLPPSSSKFVTNLTHRGIATLPIIDKSELNEIQARFLQTINSFTEFKDNNSTIHVLGGFGAYGNPSSFHNPLVRELRGRAYNKLFPYMKILKGDREDPKLKKEWRFEALFDRMMYRMNGMAPPEEAWHRDVMPANLIEKDDEVFGGWINLDSENQYFSCIPGSHLNIRQSSIPGGFDSLQDNIKRDSGKLTVCELKKKTKDYGVSSYLTRIAIPPGHLVIFPQYILHEIVANKATYNMMRLFTGWRLTASKKSLRDLNNTGTDGVACKVNYGEDIIKEQAVSPLPGGMFPPMYAKAHIMYNMTKPITVYNKQLSVTGWSELAFKPSILIEKSMTEAQKKHLAANPKYQRSRDGIHIDVAERHMHSLKYYHDIDPSIVLYPEYTPEERAILTPQLL